MDDRFCDAIALVKDRLSEEQLKFVNEIVELYESVNNGYMDWNDWNDWYEDDSEEGLEAYVCEVFGIDNSKVKQFSVDIVSKGEDFEEIIPKVLEDAGYTVLGCAWTATWTKEGYEKSEPPISSD